MVEKLSEQLEELETLKIAELELRNVTHALLGGYNAAPYSHELGLAERPRTQEIKGIWRWWTRAIVGGVIWDVKRMITEDDERALKEIVQQILGTASHKAKQSKFILQVDLADRLEVSKPHSELQKLYRESRNLREFREKVRKQVIGEIPRLVLLSMIRGRPSEEDIKSLSDKISWYEPSSLKFKVRLLRATNKNNYRTSEVRAAVGSLLIALLFQGIGAITRRGFGSIEIESLTPGDEYKADLGDYAELISKIRHEKESLEASLKKLIEKVKQDFRDLIKPEVRESKESSIPPFPIVSDRFFRMKIVSTTANNELELLRKIGNACMKVEWKCREGLGPEDPDGRFHTWILGLPRGQQRKEVECRICGKRIAYGRWLKIIRRETKPRVLPCRHNLDNVNLVEVKTGYYVGREPKEEELKEMRRPSAISFKVFSKANSGKWPVLIYGFLSSDWPISELYHIGKQIRRVTEFPFKQRPYSKEEFLEEVFNYAFSMVEKCLR